MNSTALIHSTRILATTTALFCAALFSAHSQPYIDLFQLSQTEGLAQHHLIEEQPATYRRTKADVLVPIPIGENNAAITGLMFTQQQMEVFPGNTHLAREILFKLGWNHRWNARWSSTIIALPKYSATGPIKLQSEAIQFGGLGLFKRKISDGLNLKFGLYSNADKFAPMIVPIVGGYWQSGRWEIDAALPIKARVSYQITKRWQTGAFFEGTNKSFHHSDALYLHTINNEIGAFLCWQVNRWRLQASLMHSLGRNFKLYPNNERMDLAISFIRINDNRIATNTAFSDGALLTFKCSYRLPISP